MFLTETKYNGIDNKQKKRANSRDFARTGSTFRKKFLKISSTISDFQLVNDKKSSQTRTINTQEQVRNQRISNPQSKWNKIVDLYNMTNKQQSQNYQNRGIKPGLSFYRFLSNQSILAKYNLCINFPQTFLQVSGDLMMIKTNSSTGMVESKKIQRDEYQKIMKQCLLNENKKLQQYPIKYKKHYDIEHNMHAPVIVTKIADDTSSNFEVDIESYKNFQQRRSRPSTNKIVQRFIYPRNMRAIIMRICYHRLTRGEQREEFYAYRFQNIDNIFRINKKNSQIYETFKLQSTICVTYDRENKIEYCKIINMKGLQKYIQPSKQIIWFLEQCQKIKISSIFIDFVIDLFDKPWFINIKKIEYEESKLLNDYHSLHASTRNSLHTAGSYGICRLCSSEYLKKYLRKSISNKMLSEFLAHLKKRMSVEEYQKIQFIKDIIRKNTKNYITLQVCDGCYRIVAQQYKLIECEQKLAKICSIQPKLQMIQVRNRAINMPTKLKQWRLMLYFVSAENLPAQLLKEQEEILLRYRLGSNDAIQYSWRIQTTYKSNSGSFDGNFKVDLDVQKIKVHYFYSQSLDIDHFLKETEINLQLASLKQQRIFAKGSTGTLSTFCRQFRPELCLRQTSSVLLFYDQGKYCQMTIKIGLICDGVYQFPENVALIPFKKVYFTDSSFTNSNPIPKQWMQAFGVNQEISIPDETMQKYPQKINNLFHLSGQSRKQKNKQNRNRSALSRKSMHLYR